MIQELLGGAMEQHMRSRNPSHVLPLVLPGNNPSPTSSSTSSRSSQPAHSSATSSPSAAAAAAAQQQQQQAEPLRCPRCNSSNTKFCYYNNYNLTQPRHFCKTCRRYWTKGGALRNVPIGGGCRKPRPLPAPAAKPAACKAAAPTSGGAQLGLGVGMGMGMHAANAMSWASPHATAQLMALLNGTRGCTGMQNHSRSLDHHSSLQRLLGLDSMGHLHISPSSTTACGAGAPLWPQSRPMQPSQMEQQHGGMGLMGHEVFPGLGLKSPPPPPSSSPAGAGSYYSEQLHAVVGNAGHVFAPSSLSCTAAAVPVPAATAAATAAANVSLASTVGLDAVALAGASAAAADLGYWSGTAMSAWSDLPTSNGSFP